MMSATLEEIHRLNRFATVMLVHGVALVVWGVVYLGTLWIVHDPRTGFATDMVTKATRLYVLCAVLLIPAGLLQVGAGLRLLQRHPHARVVAMWACCVAVLPSLTLICAPSSIVLVVGGFWFMRRPATQELLREGDVSLK